MAEVAQSQAAVAQDDAVAAEVEREQRKLLVRTYAYIAASLTMTTAVAHLGMGRSQNVDYALTHAAQWQVLFLLEVIAVAFISRSIEKLSIAVTALVFVGYSLVNGVSFAVFFRFIPAQAFTFGFLSVALAFGLMACYGHVTRSDLGAGRSALVMMGVGVTGAALLNAAAGNAFICWATSFLAVAVFTALASYHTQTFRDLDFAFENDDAANHKAALAGALLLSMDIVNFYIWAVRLVRQHDADESLRQ